MKTGLVRRRVRGEEHADRRGIKVTYNLRHLKENYIQFTVGFRNELVIPLRRKKINHVTIRHVTVSASCDCIRHVTLRHVTVSAM